MDFEVAVGHIVTNFTCLNKKCDEKERKGCILSEVICSLMIQLDQNGNPKGDPKGDPKGYPKEDPKGDPKKENHCGMGKYYLCSKYVLMNSVSSTPCY